MNVLSLCDGMSCCQIALNKLNKKIDTYYASEIYKEAIVITQKNFPNTIQLGDITKIDRLILSQLPKIDLIAAGTPCRGLSISHIKNYKQGLKQEESRLFYDFISILDDVKQFNNDEVAFLFENVESMKDTDKNIITKLLEVEPIMIDSNLVSAQDRKRYYWTNISNITQPINKNLVLRDIVLNSEDVPEKYWYRDKEYILYDDWKNKKIIGELQVKCHDIGKRIYNLNNKCATLTACRGGYRQKKIIQDGICRKLIPLEYERLQTVPEGYTEGVADTHRYNMLGDGWTVDVIAHILSFMNT